jgi:hypothetical protein
MTLTRTSQNQLFLEKAVIPAKAGIQSTLKTLDSRFHGNDEERADEKNIEMTLIAETVVL